MNHSVKVIFGTEQVKKYIDGLSLSEEEKDINRKEYSFQTEAEAMAFKNGISAAVGWNEAHCVDLNKLNCIHSHYYWRASRTFETTIVSNNETIDVLYIYNYDGIHFRIFYSVEQVGQFFYENYQPDDSDQFEIEEELDEYLQIIPLTKDGAWKKLHTAVAFLNGEEHATPVTDMQVLERLALPIVKILRDESNGTYEFAYNRCLKFLNQNNESFSILIVDFLAELHSLLYYLRDFANKLFAPSLIPEINHFTEHYNCTCLKAKSLDTPDIIVWLFDNQIYSKHSIENEVIRIGDTSTNFNFTYKISNLHLSDSEIAAINAIESGSKVKDRMQRIFDKSGEFTFAKVDNTIFTNNLTLIDSSLPQILAEILFLFFTSKLSKLSDLIAEVTRTNPIGYDSSTGHPFYSYKIKRFLTDAALGMKSATVWTGLLEATGGYLVIKEDGELLCYHIYSRNEFEDYLLSNTKLETPSTTKHEFGTIYRENGELYFKLNLQIRFRE